MKKNPRNIIDLIINIIWWISIIFTSLLGLDALISIFSLNRQIPDIPQPVWRTDILTILMNPSDLTPAAKISQSIIEFITMSFSLLVIYNLRKILLIVKSKYANSEVIKRIQIIGIIIIAANIVIAIIKYYFARQIFLSPGQTSGIDLKVEFNFSLELFFLGFVILAIGEIMKRMGEKTSDTL